MLLFFLWNLGMKTKVITSRETTIKVTSRRPAFDSLNKGNSKIVFKKTIVQKTISQSQ